MSLVEYAHEKALQDLDAALLKHTVAKLDDPTVLYKHDESYTITLPNTSGCPEGWVPTSTTEKAYVAKVKLAGDEHILRAAQTTTTYAPPPSLVVPAPYPFPQSPLVVSPTEARKRLVVVLPDQQAPYVNWELHSLVMAWLEHNKPDGIVLTGDLVDFPSLSTYDWQPEMDPDPINSAQLGIDTAVRLMTEYKQAAGPQCSELVLIEGNHELRWKKYLAKHAPAIYHLHVPGESEPLLSLQKLLRCRELGYQYVEGYPDARYPIARKLVACHGWVVNGKAGATALATLEALDMSVVVGHVHRQGVVYRTSNPDDGERVHVGVEAGCLCAKSPGSKDTANWQRGFTTVTVFPEGDFAPPDLATFTNGALRWRDQKFWIENGRIKKAA